MPIINYNRETLRNWNTSSVSFDVGTTYNFVVKNDTTGFVGFTIEGRDLVNPGFFITEDLMSSMSLESPVNCSIFSGSNNAIISVNPLQTGSFNLVPVVDIPVYRNVFFANNVASITPESSSFFGVDLIISY
jgi:hypothetical protein